MTASTWSERAGNLLHAVRHRRAHDARARWSRDRLAAFQRERLSAVVRWASTRSPFYRAHLGGPIDGPVELSALPTLSKDAMMASFDQVVTDPRLRLAELEPHVERLVGDELYLGELRVMSSSGSSGRKAIYVYDRAAWRSIVMTGSLRLTRAMGIAPRLPRPRLAQVAAGSGSHMTFRGGLSMDVGVFATARFAATTRLAELCRALDRHRPTALVGYPSALAMLAEEQRAGRLRIAPRAVMTTSELRTPEMTAAIRDAWGVAPYDCLGLTEIGIAAVDCEHHAGMHLFEDLSILEVVDATNRPVPDGTPGARVLVTSLWNLVQPIIRFEVSDLVTVTAAPCACGSTFRRITALEGRSDDVLDLPGPTGRVRIHPIHLRGALTRRREVVQYQITQEDDDGLDVQLVLAAGADRDAIAGVTAALVAALRDQGADVPVRTRAVGEIPRQTGAGKLKLVRARAS